MDTNFTKPFYRIAIDPGFHGIDRLNINYFNTVAQAHFMLGNLDESWQALEKSRQLCVKRGLKNPLTQIHTLRSIFFYYLGDDTRTIEEGQVAISFTPLEKYDTLNALHYYTRSLIRHGDIDVAEYYVKELNESSLKYDFWGLYLIAEELRAQILYTQNDYAKARAVLENISEKTNRRSLKQLLLGIYTLYGGIVVNQEGDVSVAQRLTLSLLSQERNVLDPWTELTLLGTLHRANQKENIKNDTIQKRATQILNALQQTATLEAFKPSFDRFYKNKILFFAG